MNPDVLHAAMKACGIHHSPAKARQIAEMYERLTLAERMKRDDQ